MSFVDDYYTIKQVVIKDKKLGRTYYVFCLLIVIYFTNAIFFNKAYLEWDNHSTATMRMRLRDPKNTTDPATLKYCQSAPNGCRSMDSYEIIYPSWPQEGYTFVTTYFEDVYERREKGEDEDEDRDEVEGSADWSEYKRAVHFVSNPEEFYFRLHHTYLASTFYEENPSENSPYSKTNQEMVGSLNKEEGGTHTEEIISWNKLHSNEFSIRHILQSLDISLDDLSQVHEHEEETIRERGAVIYITVTYNNVGKYGLVDPFFQLKARRIPETDAKVNELIKLDDLNRIIRKRYGLSIKFVQRVKIARFSFQALLSQIISGLGLLQIATFVVDLLAIYLVPHNDFYTNMKYSARKIALHEGKRVIAKENLVPIKTNPTLPKTVSSSSSTTTPLPPPPPPPEHQKPKTD